MLKQRRENSTADSPTTVPKNAAEAGASSPSVSPRTPDVRNDDALTVVCYANFCRITGTPDEQILDFSLNSQAFGKPTILKIKQRLVVNDFTAKRLFETFALSIRRHETAFGRLETDVQKRVMASLRRAAPFATPTTAG